MYVFRRRSTLASTTANTILSTGLCSIPNPNTSSVISVPEKHQNGRELRSFDHGEVPIVANGNIVRRCTKKQRSKLNLSVTENESDGCDSNHNSSSGFANLLAVSLRNYRVGGGDPEIGSRMYDSIYAISRALRPLLILMGLIGMFPILLRTYRRHRVHYFLKRSIVLSLTAFVFFLNLYFLNHNLQILSKFYDKFGLMHASTVSAVVTGMKPLINVIHLAVFIARIRAHLKLLAQFDSVDRSFWSAFGRSPDVRKMVILLLIALFIAFTIPFAYRSYESIKLSQSQPRSLHEWLTDFSLLVVPLFTIWNILPLMYYVLCNRLVCFWCHLLEDSIFSEHRKRKFSLKFYYQQFLRVADLQKSIGGLFNPFVLFSLAWSLLILSLSIYFVTQPTSKLSEPISEEQVRSEVFRKLLTERIMLNLGWACLQICIAIANICVICAVGTNTNEETRKILTAVLTVIPNSNAESDRFQISCFMHKMSTQYIWGMSVWRAFPLERSTFFTLVSVIITYSFLLLRLKDKTESAMQMQQPFMNLSYGAL